MRSSLAVECTSAHEGAARLPPIVIALAAHVTALAITIVLALIESPAQLSLPALAFTQALVAAALGMRMGLAVWWTPINLLFLPAAIALQDVHIGGAWYLLAFGVLTSFYCSTVRSRVPLYCSSEEACSQLIAMLPKRRGLRILDLGCGLGGVVRSVARATPDAIVSGCESAPVPALIAWLRTRMLRNCEVRHANFWQLDLGGYDVVYGFLSPAPMTDLWKKVRAEMKPGSLFVSNSFPVEGVEADRLIALTGSRSRALLVWQQ
ncbi:MAG TPA: class I SAM-dependent methyltransferase [Burkholderiales bacterium]|nr:class I SAM-dependent methyltransferase [Burkholderiales bacterium]